MDAYGSYTTYPLIAPAAVRDACNHPNTYYYFPCRDKQGHFLLCSTIHQHILAPSYTQYQHGDLEHLLRILRSRAAFVNIDTLRETYIHDALRALVWRKAQEQAPELNREATFACMKTLEIWNEMVQQLDAEAAMGPFDSSTICVATEGEHGAQKLILGVNGLSLTSQNLSSLQDTISASSECSAPMTPASSEGAGSTASRSLMSATTTLSLLTTSLSLSSWDLADEYIEAITLLMRRLRALKVPSLITSHHVDQSLEELNLDVNARTIMGLEFSEALNKLGRIVEMLDAEFEGRTATGEVDEVLVRFMEEVGGVWQEMEGLFA
ncbi:hypothetical protein YB2330_002327 [Saitoella coloradoensis]